MPKLHNLKALLIPFIFALIFLGGYFAYWNILSNQVKKVIAQNRGKNYEYSQLQFSGFPYRLSVKLKDFNLKLPQNFKLKSQEALITTSPFNPHKWVFDGAKELQLWNGDKFEFAIMPQKFQASMRFNQDYSLPQRISIIFDAINTQGRISRPELTIGKGALHLIYDEKTKNFAFSIELNQAQNIEFVSIPQTIILRGLINEPQNFMQNLNIWRDSGGVFDIKYGKYGDLTAYYQADNIKGKIWLDSENKLSGKVNCDFAIKVNQLKFGPINGDIYLKANEIDTMQTLSSLGNNEILRDYAEYLFRFGDSESQSQAKSWDKFEKYNE